MRVLNTNVHTYIYVTLHYTLKPFPAATQIETEIKMKMGTDSETEGVKCTSMRE